MSKLVYIAGPYTHPDPCENTHLAIKLGDHVYDVTEHFLVPVIPHLSMLWHMVVPHGDIDFWYHYDLELLARCDALYRIPGPSTGADGEVKTALDLNIPVYYDLGELFKWGRKQQRMS